jgi:hypothetical protein
LAQADATEGGIIERSRAGSGLYEGGYGYEVVDGGVRILWYGHHRGETEIIVPETIGGLPVRILGEECFYQHRYITSVELPNSLTTIENGPFYRCYSLEEMAIPASVTDIGYNPFWRCPSLTRIAVDPMNPCYADIDGVLFTKGGAVMMSYPEAKPGQSFTIPNTARRIESGTFGYHPLYLQELTIPPSVTGFPEYGMFLVPHQDDVILAVEPYSAAERYAQDLGLRYRLVDGVMYD